MDADFSVELGADEPELDFPWTDPEGKLAYFDLKRHPELLARVPETAEFPEFAEFLRAVNSHTSAVESAKCDAWSTDELDPEEEIFGASVKFASYVDVVFSAAEHRASFPFHERFARQLVELLRRTPETRSTIQLCIRRCYFRDPDEYEGCYFTVYVNGYGDQAERARQNWGIALKLTGNALLQLSATGLSDTKLKNKM
jgi:hypothetical protein